MEINSSISGSTKILGIIGNPVEHSISPYLHNTISRYLGIETAYVPFKVEKDSLENAVKGLKALGILGFNVTIPFKKDVIKYLDENSKEALLMGAVNTVKNIDGRLYGYNTDAEGFARSFKGESGTGFRGKKVVIVGAGGAARGIAVKIAIEGAEKIHVINRTLAKADDIAGIINNNIGNAAEALSLEDKKALSVFTDCDMVINTTSVGMWPETENCPLGEEFTFSKGQIVYDAVYNPLKTKFLARAEGQGCKIINGLGMLFYQGIYAYEIWTGIKLGDGFLEELYPCFCDHMQTAMSIR